MNKNNDYYTVNNSMLSKDNTISDEPSANNKPGKVHNGFTKFMITIVVWFLGACAIFRPIAAYSYYKTHSMFMWPIILGLVYYILLHSDKR